MIKKKSGINCNISAAMRFNLCSPLKLHANAFWHIPYEIFGNYGHCKGKKHRGGKNRRWKQEGAGKRGT